MRQCDDSGLGENTEREAMSKYAEQKADEAILSMACNGRGRAAMIAAIDEACEAQLAGGRKEHGGAARGDARG